MEHCMKCKNMRRLARMAGWDQHRWRGPENCPHGFYVWWRRLHRYMVGLTAEQEKRFAMWAFGVFLALVLVLGALRLLQVFA